MKKLDWLKWNIIFWSSIFIGLGFWPGYLSEPISSKIKYYVMPFYFKLGILCLLSGLFGIVLSIIAYKENNSAWKTGAFLSLTGIIIFFLPPYIVIIYDYP